MPLSLISGPPNSGRTGAILDRFVAALGHDPLLVVPTRDDVDRFERELTNRLGTVLGGTVINLNRLFEQVAQATAVAVGPQLTPAQRLRVAREAVARTELGVLRRSAARPGFGPALLQAIDEFESAVIDPITLGRRAAELGPYERELAALYAAYAEVRDELGFSDTHLLAREATSALRANPEAWGSRPVQLYGFDDLSAEQLELIGALSDAGEVTVAVTWEDRAALAARARLGAELAERGGTVSAELEASGENTPSETLYRLERSFLEPDAERFAAGDGLTVFESAGARSEAERIGAEIARLIADGVPAGEIAIVMRSPEKRAELYAQVLEGYRLPVAIEAEIPISHTATGRGLIALLRAALTTRSADDLIAFLRTPGRAHLEQVDWLERAVRRERLTSTDEAIAHWRGRDLFEIEQLRGAPGDAELLEAVARFARMTAQYPAKRKAAFGSSVEQLDLRAAEIIAAAAEALAELGLEVAPADLVEALEGLTVPLWRGSSEGRIRLLSPYRVRARRVAHLFVASLQGGEFPLRDAPASLLSDEIRARLAVPPRTDAEVEERYLFYVCLSRPTTGLVLSWCPSDEDGSAGEPSPFLDEIRGLLDPPPPREGEDPALERISRRRDLRDVCLAPSHAPTSTELARALALARDVEGRSLDGLGIQAPTADRIRLGLASAAQRGAFLPGPLTNPGVLAELHENDLFGASTLEEYFSCSYRWFAGHELDPQELEPTAEALLQGTIVHRALEGLYAEPPGADAHPTAQSLERWRERGRELLSEAAKQRGMAPLDAPRRAAGARMATLLDRFLEIECCRGGALRPALLEASFGEQGQDGEIPGDREALQLDGLRLHGKIDRVDLTASEPRAGLVHDYKTSASVEKGANLLAKRQLQLPLYMLALRHLWGIEPLGGVYVPLRAQDHRPRGLLNAARRELAEDGRALLAGDFFAEEEFETALVQAGELASEAAGGMRAGRITRNPLDGDCPTYCDLQPICRKERLVRIEEEQEAEDGREEER